MLDLASPELLVPLYIDFYREFGPDKVRKCGQAAYHICMESSTSVDLIAREKHNRKRDKKSTMAIHAV
jgi:hypothetical protein